jgi:hypothetical protein
MMWRTDGKMHKRVKEGLTRVEGNDGGERGVREGFMNGGHALPGLMLLRDAIALACPSTLLPRAIHRAYRLHRKQTCTPPLSHLLLLFLLMRKVNAVREAVWLTAQRARFDASGLLYHQSELF